MDINITVGVATKDRPEMLMKTLSEVGKQATEAKIKLHLIVYNDSRKKLDLTKLVRSYSTYLVVKIIECKDPMGLPSARNKIIQECETKYLIFLDDDDKWPATFLKRYVVRNIHKFSDAAVILGYNDFGLYLSAKVVDSKTFIMSYYSPPVGTQIFNIDIISKSHMVYDTSIRSGVDHDLFFTLYKHDLNFVLVYTKNLRCIQSLADDRITTNIPLRRMNIQTSIAIWKTRLLSIDENYWSKLNKKYDLHTDYKEFRKQLVTFSVLSLLKVRKLKLMLLLLKDIFFRLLGFRLGKKL